MVGGRDEKKEIVERHKKMFFQFQGTFHIHILSYDVRLFCFGWS